MYLREVMSLRMRGCAPLSPPLFAAAMVVVAACSGSAAQPVQTPSAPMTIDAVLASSGRSEVEKARDVYRHPKETLAFFGVQSNMHVVELWPGNGWYTKILAPYLRDAGKLTVTNFDPQTAQDHMKDMAVAYQKLLQSSPIYDKVEVKTLRPGMDPTMALGPDGSADVVLTFRNFHNWIQAGIEKDVVAAAFKVLKSGGVLGVVEHRGDPGEDEKTIKESGYVPEQRVLDVASAAGFKLAGKSDVNANPKDDHKHEGGVWALPPVLRNGDKDKDKYIAIGESDRMTLKFTKP